MQGEIVETQAIDRKNITVFEVFEKQDLVEYEYGFGDGWMHTIKLNRFIEDCNDPYARCSKAFEGLLERYFGNNRLISTRFSRTELRLRFLLHNKRG